jgi:hypothetical protein
MFLRDVITPIKGEGMVLFLLSKRIANFFFG